MVPARCDSRALEAHRPRNPATDRARTLISMRPRIGPGAALPTATAWLAALLVACSTPASAPSATTPAPTLSASPVVTVVPSLAPSPTPRIGVRAPAGVATDAFVRGEIYLGFEACVGLTPAPDSPYLPPVGQDDFVVVFPKGWKVVPAHPTSPRFGDDFQVFDAAGSVVAVDGDQVEVAGVISILEASYCGFGWPISARQAKLVGD